MRKILISVLLVFVLASGSFGAVSEDKELYLRRDVFEAKMDAFMAEIRLGFQELKHDLHEEIQGVKTELDEKIQGVKTELHAEIQSVKTGLHEEIQALNTKVEVLTERVNGIEKRMSSLETHMNWLLAAVGLAIAIVALAPVAKGIFDLKQYFKPPLTAEDVERMINTALNARLQQS